MAFQFTRVLIVTGSIVAAPCWGSAQDVTPPGSPHTHSPADSASKAASDAAKGAKPQLEYRGKVSDVWKAEVRKHGDDKDNKIVLIETDLGQIVLADLGPSDKVSVEEGSDALVIGQVLNVGGAARFVPQTVRVGKDAPAPAIGAKAPGDKTRAKQPERQKVSGKVLDKEKMSAKESKIDHQLAVLEIAPDTRILVDLGPSDQLKAIDIDEGDKLTIDGQNLEINQAFVLVADNVQKGDKKVRIQHQAAPRGKADAKTRKLAPTLENE